MPNPLRIDADAIVNYKVEQFLKLALEQNIYFWEAEHEEPTTKEYTLMQLASMPFEQWDYLIERENLHNND